MNWSFSSAKTFERCPRQWFFRQVVAHHAAKDPLRREAYLLTKIDSVWSWRGRLVDDMITERVVPGLSAGQPPNLSTLMVAAKERFDTQLEFASTHALRDDGLRPSQHHDFLALRETEAATSLSADDLEKAWQDIEKALANLLDMSDLLERLGKAFLLFPQRGLSYRRVLADGEPLTVRAVPDLIAFFPDAPPLIVDWKVHTHARGSFADQLAGYALALVATAGKWGLPRLKGWTASDIQLLEVQLLVREQRHHMLSAEAFEALTRYQLDSGTRMRELVAGKKQGDRNPYTVITTTDLSTCRGCVFRSLCWDGEQGPRFEPKENQLDFGAVCRSR